MAIVRWPFAIHAGESTMLYESQLLDQNLLRGLWAIYGPTLPDRFLAGNYPPVYILLWKFSPGSAGYIAGRTLALLGGVVAAIAGGVAVTATVEGRWFWRLIVGALGGALFLCTVPVLQQIGVAKPDMTALAFAACGLAIYALLPGWRGAVLSGICCALAGLTKQSVCFATLAIVIAAWRYHWRQAVIFAVSCGATVALALGALWTLVGPDLYEHLITYNLRSWRQDRFIVLTTRFLGQHWPVLLAAVLATVWAVWRRTRSPLGYFPLLSTVSFFMVGSDGAARNYYVELCLALGLVVALGVGDLLQQQRATYQIAGVVVAALIGLHLFRAYTLFTLGTYVPVIPLNDRDPNPILQHVDQLPDPVLILGDDPGYLVMRGRPVSIDDLYLASLLIRNDTWHPSGIIDNLQHQRYSAVVALDVSLDDLRASWGDELIDALLANYQRQQETYYPRRR